MEWWLALVIIFGSFAVLLVAGMPIAFCFTLINVVGVAILWGGAGGLKQLTLSMFSSVATWSLLPVPLFILMGEVMYQSGIAPYMMDAIDKWLGRLPGRLALLAVAGGTVFATLSGSSVAGTAMLGATLVPDMEKRGYQKPMSLGPIMGSGCLAIMIPPSGMAVIMCSLGQFSVGKTLIAIIVPGLLMAFSYAVYIILRCWRQPHLAPVYAVPPLPLSEKIVAAARYILPLAFVVLAVTGVIFLGIATPTEAAATGTAATFVLAAAYKALNWNLLKKATLASLQVTIMVFTIISGAMAFAQILAYTGATARLSELAISLPVPPICVVIIMQIVVLILGCFMDVVAIMMICLPIFMPVITQLGFDPVWFGTMFLLNIETAMITPPFGISLFVMKGVASPDTTMKDIYLGGLPFVYLNLLVIALILLIPPIALWLPSAMR